MLQQLKALELQIERIEKRNHGEDAYEHKDKLMEAIWENWPRKTLLSKDVLQMRGNALKNPEVRGILDKYHIGIEDCGLIDFKGEDHIGSKGDQECPAHSSSESVLKKFQEWEWGNIWKPWLDYYWGGPKDQIKILFQQSNNNRFKVIGLIEIFPEKKAA
jgi:hypothetical protein